MMSVAAVFFFWSCCIGVCAVELSLVLVVEITRGPKDSLEPCS